MVFMFTNDLRSGSSVGFNGCHHGLVCSQDIFNQDRRCLFLKVGSYEQYDQQHDVRSEAGHLKADA
jgi:hypothetical protein